MTAIRVERLNKTFDYYRKEPGFRGSLRSLLWRQKLHHQAVRDISFSIAEGELVGFLGPNGAGKTTTLKILSGILHPTSGEVSVLGHVPWRREAAYQRLFAIVMGQKNQLWWDLPARESFELNRDIYGIDRSAYRRTLNELVAVLGVGQLLDVQVRKLSMGERMKCELIAALLHEPRVLFLDEPTIGLDVVSQESVRAFVQEYNRGRRTTVLLTSHYMRDVEQLCDRVLVISAGEIIYDGRLSDLAARYAEHKVVTLRLTQPVDGAALTRYGQLVEQSGLSVTLNVPKKDLAQAAQGMLSALPVEDLSIEEVAIETVIARMFTAGAGDGRTP
ncbi:MAG: ATP-binding cassette domain-containing protein [Candidatus Latescibacterota bacterium]